MDTRTRREMLAYASSLGAASAFALLPFLFGVEPPLWWMTMAGLAALVWCLIAYFPRRSAAERFAH